MWQIEVMWRATPWAPAGLAISLLLAALVARPLARRFGTSTVGAGVWALLVGVILTLTVTPSLSRSTVPWCALGWPAPVTPGELFAFRERGLNAWMLVPLAFVSALPRRPGTVRAAVAATVALPFVVEAIQFAVPALGRACQARDVGANLTGVAIGLAAGGLARLVREVRRADRTPTAA